MDYAQPDITFNTEVFSLSRILFALISYLF